MHGRLKVKTTAEKQAEKEKERAGKIKVRVLQIKANIGECTSNTTL